MILRKRAEEILNLVHKEVREISLPGQAIVGDVYIGTGETDAVRFIPFQDIWGGLMRRDSPLAVKETVSPEDFWDKPLILLQ